VTILVAVFTVALSTGLMIGCDNNSVDSQMGSTVLEPAVSTNLKEAGIQPTLGIQLPEATSTQYQFALPESQTLFVHQIIRDQADIYVQYSVGIQEDVGELRTVRYHESSRYFLIYGENGVLQSGYGFSENKSGQTVGSFVSDQTLFQVVAPDGPSATLALSFSSAGSTQSIEFASVEEMEFALQTLESAGAEGTEAANEAYLQQKAQIVKDWMSLIPDVVSNDEIQILNYLCTSPEYVGPPVGPNDPAVQLDAWIRVVCEVIRTVKRICSILPLGEEFCDYVDVLVNLCDVYEKHS